MSLHSRLKRARSKLQAPQVKIVCNLDVGTLECFRCELSAFLFFVSVGHQLEHTSMAEWSLSLTKGTSRSRFKESEWVLLECHKNDCYRDTGTDARSRWQTLLCLHRAVHTFDFSSPAKSCQTGCTKSKRGLVRRRMTSSLYLRQRRDEGTEMLSKMDGQ